MNLTTKKIRDKISVKDSPTYKAGYGPAGLVAASRGPVWHGLMSIIGMLINHLRD